CELFAENHPGKERDHQCENERNRNPEEDAGYHRTGAQGNSIDKGLCGNYSGAVAYAVSNPKSQPGQQKQENQKYAQKQAVAHVHSYMGKALLCNMQHNTDADHAEGENRQEDKKPGLVG